jgi:hypothetical protein
MPLEDRIALAHARWRVAFARACRHDRIESRSALVLWSPDNPHAAAVNAAVSRYFDLARKANSDDQL